MSTPTLASPDPLSGEPGAKVPDPAAAHRVLTGAALERSPRLRQLLEYLLRHSADASGAGLREQEIGVAVFGRANGYDTSHDTIVRVQVAQLRKKLEQHFDSQGASEPAVLTIGKGTYRATWQERPSHAAEDKTLPAPPAKIERSGWRVWGGVVLVALLSFAAGWTASTRNTAAKPFFDPEGQPAPALTAFWNGFYSSNDTNHLVVADAGLPATQVLLGRPVSLSEYVSGQYVLAAAQQGERWGLPLLVQSILQVRSTSTADAAFIGRVQSFRRPGSPRLSTVMARDFQARLLNLGSTVIVGSRRSNPWAGLLEAETAFAEEYDESGRMAAIRNRKPQGNELALYQPSRERGSGRPVETFAFISYLPNPARAGHVLLLSGVDREATEAAGRFLTNEALFAPFASRLRKGGAIPNFDLLLRSRKFAGTLQDVSVVTWRARDASGR